MEAPAQRGPAPASPRQPASSWAALQRRVTAPLVEVQACLQRDAVVWQRGLLATPPIVRLMLRSEFKVRLHACWAWGPRAWLCGSNVQLLLARLRMAPLLIGAKLSCPDD